MQLTESVETNQSKGSALVLKERLRKDLRFLVFYLAPLLDDFRDEAEWLAERFNLESDKAKALREQLIASGFWMHDDVKGVRPNRARLGLGEAGDVLSTSEFMAIITQMLFRISADGPCWFESHTVVTSREVKLEFLSQVGLALNTFLEKSKTAPGETVVSWAHVSLDTLKAIQEENEEES